MAKTPLLNSKRKKHMNIYEDNVSLNDYVKKYFEENATNSRVSYQEFSPTSMR